MYIPGLFGKKRTAKSDVAAPTMKKVSFEMSDKSIAQLDEMRAIMGADNYAEVFRNALRAFSSLCEEYEKGNRFQLVKPDGSVEEYKIFVEE